MQVRIDDPELAPDLLTFLRRRVDLVMARTSETEAAVSVLGSFADGGHAELDSYLEGWRRANPSASVEVERDGSGPPSITRIGPP